MSARPEPKARSRILIGLSLVLGSYLFWAASLLLAGFAVSTKGWAWGRLAVLSYGGSWLLFGAGVLLAGPDVVRSGRRWVVNRLRRLRR